VNEARYGEGQIHQTTKTSSGRARPYQSRMWTPQSSSMEYFGFLNLFTVKRQMAFVRWLKRMGIISTARFGQLALIREDVAVRNLRDGIPFEEGTLDLVYHSHLLDHMDHEDAIRLCAFEVVQDM